MSQVSGPLCCADYDEESYQWNILYEQRSVREAEIAAYSLPVWAGTWKIMNFVFRQQKHMWDHLWANYKLKPTDRLELILNIDEEVRLLLNIYTLFV